MNKRILCLVLALVMVLGAFTAVFAEESKVEVKDVPKYTNTDHKIQWLQDNGIVSGRKVNANGENNDLALDKTILRGEVTKLLVYAIGKQDLATQLANVVRAFKDVEPTHWANGYIAVGTTSASPANGLPFLNGYPDGTFHADWNVNYAELAKMLVVLTKKDLTPAMVKSANANWPSTWLTWAAQGGILDGVKYVNSSDNAVRKDAFAMIYNALYAMKEWRLYPTSETIGVISGYKAGKLYLNGDEKKEFVVNENTTFVPASDAIGKFEYNALSWDTLVAKYGYDSKYYLGSLVRVITNDKNEVTHIIQLGNPVELDRETQGWAPIANGHANGVLDLRADDLTFVDFRTKDDLDKVSAQKTNSDFTLQKGGKIFVDSKTRYFVADAAQGQFGELKSMDEVRSKLFNHTRRYAYNVYVGYETTQVVGKKLARLVVFNTVDNDNFSTDLVRIKNQITSKYNVIAQKPGKTSTEELAYNLGSYKYYPYAYEADLLDVVKLNALNGTIKVEIDHNKDDIFEITHVYPNTQNRVPFNGVYRYIRALELRDKYNRRWTYDLATDAKAWFGDQIVEGKSVQVKFDGREITMISVLPTAEALRGELKGGDIYGTIYAKGIQLYSTNRGDVQVLEYKELGVNTAEHVGVLVPAQYTVDPKAEIKLVPAIKSAGYVDWNGKNLPIYTIVPVEANAKAALEAYKDEPTEANQKALDAAVAELSEKNTVRDDAKKAEEGQAALKAQAEKLVADHKNSPLEIGDVTFAQATVDTDIAAAAKTKVEAEATGTTATVNVTSGATAAKDNVAVTLKVKLAKGDLTSLEVEVPATVNLK